MTFTIQQRHSRERRLQSCFREVDEQAEQRRKREENRRRYEEAYIAYKARTQVEVYGNGNDPLW